MTQLSAGFSALISMLGAVSLLLWGTYMVKTGILRTFGDALREYLADRLKTRAQGFVAGTGLALMLQSSTASALLIAGLQGKGLVGTKAALAAVLGADLGSAAAARILSLDLALLIPLLTLAGTALFLRQPDCRAGQFGRILLGLAFILSAIAAIRLAAAPLHGAEGQTFLSFISGNALCCAAAGMLLAAMSFSSLAAVTITAGAAAAGGLTSADACWCVLGANLGSAALALVSTAGSSAAVRRAPAGNAVFRTAAFAAGAAVLVALPEIPDRFTGAGGAVSFHLTFNAAAGVLGLGFIAPVAKLMDRLLPGEKMPAGTSVRIIGIENMLTAEMMIRELRSETARSAELLHSAWDSAGIVLARNLSAGEVLEACSRFESVRRRGRTIEAYLGLLVRKGLSTSELSSWKRLNEANDALSLAARMAEQMVRDLGSRKCAPGRSFSAEGLAELEKVHGCVSDQIRRFEILLVAEDAPAQRSEKSAEDATRISAEILETQSQHAQESFALVTEHMKRVAEGRAPSVETSALHMDLLSLFRRVEGVIAAAVRNGLADGAEAPEMAAAASECA